MQKDQSAYKTNQRNYMHNTKGTYLELEQPWWGDQPWRIEGKRSSEALKRVAKFEGQASFSLSVDSIREERSKWSVEKAREAIAS